MMIIQCIDLLYSILIVYFKMFKQLYLYILAMISLSSCLYVNLYKGKPKCFFDHFFEDMNIIIHFNILNSDTITLSSPNDSRLILTVRSKTEKKIIHSFRSSKLKGKSSFHTDLSDEYKICIQSDDSDVFRAAKVVKLDINIDTNEDYLEDKNKVAKMKDFELVDDKLKKMIKKAETIEKMQEYQVTQEGVFSNNQISNSKRIAVITMIQIGIIILIGIMHVFTLRRLFKEKIWMPF